MKLSKKLLSLLLCAVMVLGSVAIGGGGFAEVLDAFSVKASATSGQQVADYANSRVGDYFDYFMCLRFAEQVYQEFGASRPYDCCAHKSADQWIVSSSSQNIPLGAAVYFNNANDYCDNCGRNIGHVGIYVGNGEFVSVLDTSIQRRSLSNDTRYGNYWINSYIGWGWIGGYVLQTQCDHSSHNARAEIEKWPTATACGTRRRYCECGQTSVTEDIHPLPYTSIGNGVFSIKSALGNTYASAVSDKNVKLWNNGFVAEDQKWRFTRNSDGTYTIESYYYSGYCMDVNGASMLRGANVQAYQANGTDAQKFYVVPKDGHYEIINKKSLMAIDVEDSNTANGTNISQWSTHGGTNQLWDISPIVLDIKVGSKPVSSNYNPTTGSSITISWGAAVNAPSGLEYCVSLCNYNDEIVYGPYWTTATSKSITVTQTGTYYANVYIIPNGAIHTYAQSDTITVKPGTHTVSYNANGGTGAPGSQTKTHGTNLTLSSTKPTRSVTITLNPQSGTVSPTSKTVNYTFKNWNTKADGSGTAYSSGATYSANAAATLYAQWTNPAAYILPTPTRTGYNFKCWNTKADGTGTNYSAGAGYCAKANVTLYAIWSIKTYSVTYDANGGTGAPANQTKKYGTDLTLSSTEPTRTGYAFISWNTAKDGSGTTYACKGAIYSDNAPVTLYAQWSLNSYSIDYNVAGFPNQRKGHGVDFVLPSETPYGRLWIDSNGGKLRRLDSVNYFSSTTAPFLSWNTEPDGSGITYMPGDTYTVDKPLDLYAQWDLSNILPFRAGYYFTGWNTEKDGSGRPYAGYINTTGTKYLYAQWSKCNDSILFDANGGIGGPFSQSAPLGTDLVLSSDVPTRMGYTFTEWNTKKDGSGESYLPGDTIHISEQIFLYAQWGKNNYTVTFDANGGTNAPENYSGPYSVRISISSEKPSRTGYDFRYWNTKADGSGKSYYVGDSYSLYEDVTLYAIWSPKTYCVQYIASDYLTYLDAYYRQNKIHDESIILRSSYLYGEGQPGNPIDRRDISDLEGRVFYGWNTKPDGSGQYYAPGSVYSENKPIELYEQWSPFSITYDANGGSNVPGYQIKIPGTDIVISPVEPSKSIQTKFNTNGGTALPSQTVNCTFNNWNTKADGSGESYAPGAVYSADSSATLYAQWIYPSAFTLPSTTREDYVLISWNTKKDGTGISYAVGESYCATGTLTLYAQWAPAQLVVSFDTNGGSVSHSCEEVIKGTNIILPTPEKVGYIFIGWNTKLDGTGTSYEANSNYNVTADVMLYAMWQPIQYTVKFANSSGKIIYSEKYTVETDSVTAPEVPKVPYKLNGRWQNFDPTKGGNVSLRAIYESPTTIMAAQKTVFAGDSFKLPPSANYEVESSEWSSDNEAVAVVDSYGRVTALCEGVCRITVVTHGKDDFGNPISSRASTKVIVNCVGSDGLSSENNSSMNARTSFEAVFIGLLRDIVENLKMIFRFLSPYISNK